MPKLIFIASGVLGALVSETYAVVLERKLEDCTGRSGAAVTLCVDRYDAKRFFALAASGKFNVRALESIDTCPSTLCAAADFWQQALSLDHEDECIKYASSNQQRLVANGAPPSILPQSIDSYGQLNAET